MLFFMVWKFFLREKKVALCELEITSSKSNLQKGKIQKSTIRIKKKIYTQGKNNISKYRAE